MSAKKYVSRKIEIEAIQYNGENENKILEFMEGISCVSEKFINIHKKIKIKTLEGTMTAIKGDFIIKGIKGEFYPCKPDIFYRKYVLSENVEKQI